MQNTYGINVPANSGGRAPLVYKVNKAEEKKAIARQEAMGMIENRIDHEKTIHYLVEAGYSSQDASELVAGLEAEKERLRIQKGQKKVFFGGLWMVFGIMIALLSYYIINVNAGFVVSGVVILFGVMQVLKGLAVGSG
ncbi:MAG: hypothetical protein MI921_16000 [Cytophagales bacterium]|nr:hypothetical protein [Cytophagales bacterium]